MPADVTKRGGGVYVYSGATFTLRGGIITENVVTEGSGYTIERSGGGVYNRGSFSMTGGSISKNNASSYGSGVLNVGDMYVSGTAIIKDNTTTDAYINFYSGTFNLSGNLSPEAEIRVSYPTPVLGGTICSNPNNYSGVRYIVSTDESLMGDMSGTNVVWTSYVPPVAGLSIPVKVSGVWKDSVPQVKVNGVWKNVIGVWTKVLGEWKTVGSVPPGPIVDTGVYTISWTESSTSNNITWSGDAAGMTEAQRLSKIKEHSHFAVVKWDSAQSKPVVNYWLYDNNLNYKATDETGKTSSGTASNLTGTDGDVMMLYEPVWWKVTTSGSGTSRTITISFTWDKSKTDSTWVSPHHYGDSLSSTTYAQYVGQGVFPAYNSSSQMRSINTSSEPTGNVTQNNFYNAAIYGRNWQYNNKLPMTYAWYIIQMYFVKGDRNCQNAYGNGICSASSYGACNVNWSATSPWINGTTANQTTGVTALGVHNPWGQKYEFMGEMRNDGGTVKFSVLGGKDHYNIESGTASTWKSLSMYATSSWGCVAGISSACQEYPFMATSVSGTDYSTYYADGAYGSSSSGPVVAVGGDCSNGLRCGPLFVTANGAASLSGSYLGARLHVVIT